MWQKERLRGSACGWTKKKQNEKVSREWGHAVNFYRERRKSLNLSAALKTLGNVTPTKELVKDMLQFFPNLTSITLGSWRWYAQSTPQQRLELYRLQFLGTDNGMWCFRCVWCICFIRLRWMEAGRHHSCTWHRSS